MASCHGSRVVEQQEDAEGIDESEYDKLLKMQERESRILVSLATKMRMTQQATYDPEKGKGSTPIRPPWEN